jgi:tetratricopeptide (TPR) repeat protein
MREGDKASGPEFDSGPTRVAIERHNAVLTALEDGRIDDAQDLAAEAVEAATAAFPSNSPDLASILLTCATAHEEAGDFAIARQLAERAATVAENLVETTDRELMSLWVDIQVTCAGLLSTCGEFNAAEARLRTALNSAGKILGGDNPHLLSIHNMRGVTAKFAGRFDDAQAHYSQVRAVLDTEPIADPEALATLLHNLAGLDHSRGEYARGLSLAERGLRLRIDTIGPDHPDVARDLNAIGALYHELGDAAAADCAYGRALRIFEQALGKDHYEVAMTAANLAVSKAEANEAETALALYRRALAILERCLGTGHPDVALVQHNLAVLLLKLGDTKSAADLFVNAEEAIAGLSPDHPRRMDLEAAVVGLSLPGRD